MRSFIIGLVAGSLIFGGVAFYVYNDGKAKLDSSNAKARQLEQTKTIPNTNTPDTSQKDVSTLAAELRNRRLEVLSTAQGDEFDRNYVQMVNTITGEASTLAIEARKRAATPEVRALADKLYIESTNMQRELGPLRSRFSLID